jgi:SAM-dependent methyltransferase
MTNQDNSTNYDKCAKDHAKIYSFASNTRPYDEFIVNKYMFPSIDTLQWDILTILSYGCGNTNFEQYLIQKFPHKIMEIVGVDVSEISIKIAQNQNIAAKTTYHVITPTADNLMEIMNGKVVDYVSMIYVVDVIEKDEVIKASMNNIYQTMNQWWIIQIIMWSPEDFYGKECKDFTFPLKHQEDWQLISTLTHGESYPVILWDSRTDEYIQVTDFYRTTKTIEGYLKESWFGKIVIEKVYAPTELEDARDLISHPWSAIITAYK